MHKTLRLTACAAVLGLAMGFTPAGSAEAQEDAELIEQWQALSAGDQSTLPRALSSGEAVLMTVAGSANDAFWSELVARGWMRRVDPPEGLPPETRTYAITPDGRRPLAKFLTANPATSTAPDIAFYADRCDALFRDGDQVYSRPAEEMPWVAMFALGYYTAASSDGLSVNEIATRKDVIPRLRQRCLNQPEESFLDALAQSVPEPLSDQKSDQGPASGDLMFGGACDGVFGAPPKSFKGNPNEFTMLVHFVLGYYTATGTDWQLDPADLDDRRDLMPMVYDACMRDPGRSLTSALDETVPGRP